MYGQTISSASVTTQPLQPRRERAPYSVCQRLARPIDLIHDINVQNINKTATFKDLHIENSKNYKRWYCPHHTDCVSMCCWINITFCNLLLFSMCKSLNVAVNKCINWCFVHLWESLTLDDLEGQRCNRNCISCSASSLVKLFMARKFSKAASDICVAYLRL